MGDDSEDRITVLKNNFDKILSNHEINNNRALINELVEEVKNLYPDEHPKFEIGEEREEFSKDELDIIEKEEIADIVDEEESYLRLLKSGKLKHRDLEKKVDAERAVIIRKKFIQSERGFDLSDIPHEKYDWQLVKGACCENPIGYIPIPLGIAGPIRIEGEDIYLPLATTEGALIASISRGCKVVSEGEGVACVVKDVGMTRAPYFSFKDIKEADQFVNWIEKTSTFEKIKSHFDHGSSYCKLSQIKADSQGSKVYLRFVAKTGDAMGMNMVSKACEHAVNYISKKFPNAELRSLSSNYCTDKKAAAINWIERRGKKVTSAVRIKAETVKSILHTTVDKMVELNIEKNLEGSSMAATVGGNNAQAANVVAAMFLATGQDAAQVVCSSMCITTMRNNGGDLIVECTMNCLEVGTVGGGTILAPQKTSLKILNCAGSNIIEPGRNACRLAKIICAAVLAGEVSLMAALCTKDLVKSHMKMNRSDANVQHANTESDLRRVALKSSIAAHSIHNNSSVANVPQIEMKDNSLLPGSNLGPNSPCFRRMKPGGCANLV